MKRLSASMVKWVNTADLKSAAERLEDSSSSRRTIKQLKTSVVYTCKSVYNWIQNESNLKSVLERPTMIQWNPPIQNVQQFQFTFLE